MKTILEFIIVVEFITFSQIGLCQSTELSSFDQTASQLYSYYDDRDIRLTYKPSGPSQNLGFNAYSENTERVINDTIYPSSTATSRYSTTKSRIYRTQVFKDQKSILPYQMYLYAVNDSSIRLIKPAPMDEILHNNYMPMDVNIKDIDMISLQSNKIIGRCSLIGGLTGFTCSLGFLLIENLGNDLKKIGSLGTYNEPGMSDGDQFLIVIGSTVVGAGLGALIGSSIKQKISINGDQLIYNLNRQNLKQKAIRK